MAAKLVYEDGTEGAEDALAGRAGRPLRMLDMLEMGRSRMESISRMNFKGAKRARTWLGQEDPQGWVSQDEQAAAGGGFSIGGVFGDLFGMMSTGIGYLATAVAMPLDLIGAGATAVIDGLSGLVSSVPLVGPAIGIVLTIGKVILNAGLKLPEMILRAFANVLGVFAKLPADKQKALSGAAMTKIIEFGKEKGREDEVRKVLADNAPTAGGSVIEPPASGAPGWLTAAAGIGIPVVAVAGAAVLS